MADLEVSSAIDTFMASASLAEMRTNIALETQRLINSTNAAASAPPVSVTGTWFTGGSATTTKPQLLIEPTGTTSTGWSAVGTGIGVNAATGFTGNLLDLQLVGAARITGDYLGGLWSKSNLFTGGTAGNPTAGINAGGFLLSRDMQLAWTSNAASAFATPDLILLRGAANTVAQRNAANAQAYHLFGTYTDGSNYRSLIIGSTTAGVFSLTPTGAGTGASGNVIHISGIPTSNPGPGILWNNAGTLAIGT